MTVRTRCVRVPVRNRCALGDRAESVRAGDRAESVRAGARRSCAVSHAASSIWWRIAWRNLGRNRRRTLLTASALSFGFVASVLMIGYMDGMVEEMIANGTQVATGQVQIHAEDYEPERSIHDTMGGREGLDLAALLAAVEAQDGVLGAAPRLYGGGLISSGDETVGGVLMGVDAAREAAVSRFGSALVAGRMPGAGEIALGDAMAGAVGVGVGDEVVLVAPAADGSTGNDLFTVSGVFSVGVGAFDDSYALLDLASLGELMAMVPGRVHEVAVTVDRIREADVPAARIEEAVARGWRMDCSPNRGRRSRPSSTSS